DKGMNHIGHLRNLEWLFLEDTKITDNGIKKIESLPKLTTLHVSRTSLTDQALDSIIKMKTLQRLKLNETKITDRGLRKLHGLKQLTYLEIHNTNISQEAINDLKKSIPKLHMITHRNY
ncbi:MAG: hypothetical protein JXM79_08025, partial [Sedimentisphaerales bacterium]|nr:hypothetical protein [Sedimentisphaerales bacterium]